MRHGNYAWSLAHIDHTELDLVLCDSRTGQPLGKCWLTLLILAHPRRIAAYYLCWSADKTGGPDVGKAFSRAQMAIAGHVLGQIVTRLGEPCCETHENRLLAEQALAFQLRPFAAGVRGDAIAKQVGRQIGRQRLIDEMKGLNYDLIDSWKVPELQSEIPFYPEYSQWYSGMYFRIKDDGNLVP